MPQQIIFFDGVCNLCNGFVDFLLKRDQEQAFVFSSLQGERAKELLPAETIKSLSSVVLWSQGQTFEKSDAVLLIAQQLGGFWKATRIFMFIPKSFRDLVYDCVAKSRYFVFGKRNSCRMPTPDERKRFLA